MSKKRKVSNNASLVKVEIKEENVYGDDVLLARGRLKGVLQELVEQSDEEDAAALSSGDEDSPRKHRYYYHRSPKRKEPLNDLSSSSSRFVGGKKQRRSDNSPIGKGSESSPYHHTYVMKLFDRSVDLARFEEDTPLYPICRAWMANQPRNPQMIVKRRTSTPERDNDDDNNEKSSLLWSSDRLPLRDVYEMPAAILPALPLNTRISSSQHDNNDQTATIKSTIDERLNADDDAQLQYGREQLLCEHMKRWTTIKHKWIEQANKNEERFEPSFQILTAIYNRAQENME